MHSHAHMHENHALCDLKKKCVKNLMPIFITQLKYQRTRNMLRNSLR